VRERLLARHKKIELREFPVRLAETSAPATGARRTARIGVMRALSRLAPSALLLSLVSLGRASPARAEEPPAPAAPAKAAAAPEIRLIDVGVEPRATLRYAFEKGQSRLAEVRMEAEQETTADGQRVLAPGALASTMTLRSTVDEVAEDGSADLRWEVLELGVKVPTEIPPEKAKSMADLIARVRFTIRIHVTSRGLVTSSTVELPQDVTGPAREVVEKLADAMKDGIGEWAANFPEEAVGTGASWTVERTKQTPFGIESRGTITSRLGAVEGGRATIHTKFRFQADEQDFALPKPVERKAHLRSLTSEGTARLALDPMNFLSDAELHAAIAMTVSSDVGTGVPTVVTTTQTLTVTLRGKP